MTFNFREAIRIDFAPRVPMAERLQAKKQELIKDPGEETAPGVVDETAAHQYPTMAERLEAKKQEMNQIVSDGDVEMSNLDFRHPSEADIAVIAGGDASVASKIRFILKLCTCQLACGQCSVDAEDRASNAAIALGLSPPLLELGPRVMHAAFSEMKANAPFLLGTSRDIVLWKLQDVTALSVLVATQGESFTDQDIEACSFVLQEIMDKPSPYGWLVQDILSVALSTFAAIAAFFGSYADMVVVFVIALFVLGVQKLRNRFPQVLAPIELVVVNAMVGLLTAAAYRIARNNDLGQDNLCNITVIFLSPMLVYLPGSELIYGAYEVQMGHMVVGSARLVSALIKCMVMASGLTIGWQFTGYNLMKDVDTGNGETIGGGVMASFVPSTQCQPFKEEGNVGPWWHVFALWNLVLLVPCLAGLQVHPRDFLNHYLLAYVSLMVFGALNFAGGGVGLSNYIINIIGLFVATNLACLKEFFTGVPAVSSIVPVLLVLAPGSAIVLQILTAMQVNSGVVGTKQDSDIVSYLWLLGLTYALGMYIALALWKPFLLKRGVAPSILNKARKNRCRNSVFDGITPKR